MGDFIEFTTWPHHQSIFYKFSSAALAFSVKGQTPAAVRLAKRPGDHSTVYKIVIGYDTCWAEENRSQIAKSKHTGQSILSRNVFKDFWITWHSGQIKFGNSVNGIAAPTELLSVQTENLFDYKFVAFSVYTEPGYLQWKLHLPLKLEKPLPRKVRDGEMRWVEADEQLPKGALIGGNEKEILYIIRAAHQGSLTPGKFVPSQGLGFIPWGGEMHEKNKLEVLCGYNCVWVKTSKNRIPAGAVEGGYSEENHETLYIGRANEGGHLIPGKVQPSHSVCYIPYNEKEVAKKQYEILVNPDLAVNPAQCIYVSGLDDYEPEVEIRRRYCLVDVGHLDPETTDDDSDSIQ